MRLKELLSDKFTIAAVMHGANCTTEQFLMFEDGYSANRTGLTVLLQRISEHGLNGLSSKLCHLADVENGIYELIKGDLRLLFFKGQNDVLVVCCSGFIKKGQSPNKKAVSQAVRDKDAYKNGLIRNSIEWIEQEEN